MMQLSVVLPAEMLLTATVRKVTVEASDGQICLLPRHSDWVAVLVPGVLCFETETGSEEFVAVDEGTLVKCGSTVHIATRRAVRGSSLATLQQLVAAEFARQDDREKLARAAVARLEAGFVRGALPKRSPR